VTNRVGLDISGFETRTVRPKGRERPPEVVVVRELRRLARALATTGDGRG
jgi:hypothetical protein